MGSTDNKDIIMAEVTDVIGKEKLTVEEIIDRMLTKLNFKLVLFGMFSAVTCFAWVLNVMSASFAGDIRYNEWECVSDKCRDLKNSTGDDTLFYTQQGLCNSDLKEGLDFNWTVSKNTFSIEWGLYCSREADSTMITSIFLGGNFIGMVASSAIYDQIGRKNGAVIGGVIELVSSAASAFAPSFEVMLVTRLVAGFGSFIHYMGYICWLMEFSSGPLRNVISLFLFLAWSFGYYILIGISYAVDEWRHIYYCITGICTIFLVPLLFIPESPRFHLVKGKDGEARKTLNLLAKISKSKMSMDDIDLVYKIRNQKFLEQISDFKHYPTMLKETLITMITWFLISLVMHGYYFGWGKLSNNIYIAYGAAATTEMILFLSTVPIVDLLGRKRATICFLLITIVCNFIAMIHYKFHENWSVELLGSLVGSMAITGSFNVMYLMTMERAPTTHSGMILSLGGGMARTGGILSPPINLLYGITSRRVPLALYAGLAFISLVGVAMLPDTTGQPIPETPTEFMRARSNKVGVEGGLDTNKGRQTIVHANPIVTELAPI